MVAEVRFDSRQNVTSEIIAPESSEESLCLQRDNFRNWD